MAASMGSLADATGTGERRNQSGSMGARQWYRGSAKIADEAAPDFLVLELYDDYGPFAGGDVVPGTYEIGEEDAAIDSCGLCAYVYADVDEGTGTAQELYLAQSGTVVIEQVEPELVGSITGATFAEIDPVEETLVADGCATALDDVAYTVALTCYGSNDGGGSGDGGGGGGGGGGGEPVPCGDI